MAFLVVLGVIGLAGIGATVYAIVTDGYGSERTRDAAFLRDYEIAPTASESAVSETIAVPGRPASEGGAA